MQKYVAPGKTLLLDGWLDPPTPQYVTQVTKDAVKHSPIKTLFNLILEKFEAEKGEQL